MKIHFVLIFFFAFCLNSCKAQKDNCDCSVILIPKQIEIPLYDKPLNKIVFTIKNDTVKEDYCLIQLKSISKDWAKISATTVSDTTTKIGWIEKKYMGIYPNPYFGDIAKLYSDADTISAVKSTIIKPEFSPANIFQCKGKWLYIKYMDADNKMKEGWLSPDDQCANPYTTCN